MKRSTMVFALCSLWSPAWAQEKTIPELPAPEAVEDIGPPRPGVEPAPAAPPTPGPVPRWLQVSRCSIPSENGTYIGYYVGGGCANFHKAEPRLPEEGTWGWDYQGRYFLRRVNLGWWHGRRYQGGEGAYRTDGPHLTKLPE